MEAFLHMVKMLYWHVLIKIMGLALPTYLRIGYLDDLYKVNEVEEIYRRSEDALARCKKNGAFSKNDFFELMMYMIPVG